MRNASGADLGYPAPSHGLATVTRVTDAAACRVGGRLRWSGGRPSPRSASWPRRPSSSCWRRARCCGGAAAPEQPADRGRVRDAHGDRHPHRDADADTAADTQSDADRHPDADPDPDPDARPCAADRPARPTERRRASSDRGDDRRPSPGPSAVRHGFGLGRLAGPGRGRDPALHGHLPGQHARGGRPGPERPLLLHRLGGRMAGPVRPRRRLAAGHRDPPGEGQRPVGLQRRRVPLQRDLLPAEDQAGARTICTRPARSSAPWPSSGTPRTSPTPRSGSSPPTRRSRPGRTAGRSPSAIRTTSSPTSTTGRPTPTCGR